MKLTTKEMEHLIYRYLWKQGTYLCFEVMMPDARGRYMYNNERVDLLYYENPILSISTHRISNNL